MQPKQKQLPPGLAAKALIIHQKKILLLRRSANDIQDPETWEIPGGRMNPGEDPYKGLQRETMEEAGITITIHNPLDVQTFTRNDGQIITGIIFRCTTNETNIVLSEEHNKFDWVSREDKRIPNWLQLALKRSE